MSTDERAQASSNLERRFAQLLDRRRRESKLRNLKASPAGSLKKEYLAELQQHTSRLGSTGSRLLDGNSELAESLEKEIAAFHGSAAGLLANSGFDANVSLFSCLPQPGDIVLYDELIHASVHDGMRQSRARNCIAFTHNCVVDLRERLELCKRSYDKANIFVAVETVYSMEGDLAPLTEIVEMVEDVFPEGNAHIIVDEAHATGIYGEQGRGRVCELGLEDRIFVRLHTFGKALACNGAIILTTPLTRLYLLNYARPLIYTTFLSHPSLLAIKQAYNLLQSPHTLPRLRNSLTHLIETLHALLMNLSTTLSPPPHILSTPSTRPQSPIFALMTQNPRSLAARCQAEGFVVRAVVPPTVPEGTERIRVCLHAENREEDVRRLVEVVRGWVIGEMENEMEEKGTERAKLNVLRESGRGSGGEARSGEGRAVLAKL